MWAADRIREQARLARRVAAATLVRVSAFLLVCSLSANLFAQSSGGSEPEYPTFGVDPTTTLQSVQTALTTLFWPFILFSIGVCVLFMLWRAARRFASGNA